MINRDRCKKYQGININININRFKFTSHKDKLIDISLRFSPPQNGKGLVRYLTEKNWFACGSNG